MTILRSERMRNLIQALDRAYWNVVVHPFTIMMVALAAAWLYFHEFSSSDTLDTNILAFIAFVKLASALFMLVRTRWRDWTILSSGMMLSFLTVGILYSYAAWNRNHTPPSFTEELLIFIRAGLVVGGIFVIIGMIQEWWIEGGYTREGIFNAFRHPINTLRIRRELKREEKWFKEQEKHNGL